MMTDNIDTVWSFIIGSGIPWVIAFAVQHRWARGMKIGMALGLTILAAQLQLMITHHEWTGWFAFFKAFFIIMITNQSMFRNIWKNLGIDWFEQNTLVVKDSVAALEKEGE